MKYQAFITYYYKIYPTGFIKFLLDVKQNVTIVSVINILCKLHKSCSKTFKCAEQKYVV